MGQGLYGLLLGALFILAVIFRLPALFTIPLFLMRAFTQIEHCISHLR